MQFGFNGMAYASFWFFRGDTPMLDQWIPADVCLFLAIAGYYNIHKKAGSQTQNMLDKSIKIFKENKEKNKENKMTTLFSWNKTM